MSGAAEERLRRQISDRRAVFLIGAGVSLQITAGRVSAGWPGFVKTGIAVAEAATDLPDDWAGWLDGLVERGGLDDRLLVEEELVDRMGGVGSAVFSDWLRRAFEDLPVADKRLAEALAGLGLPLMTLNYDDLLERVTGWPSVTWRDPKRMRRVVHGDEPGVIHLHGVWTDPKSVVLGTASHERIKADDETRRLVSSVSYAHSLVLLGFGAPLDSLHFQPLRTWLFDSPEYRHFRLISRPERGMFENQPQERKHVTLIEYGDSFANLPAFLRTLGPAEKLPNDGDPPESPTRRRQAVSGGSATGALALAIAILDGLGYSGVLMVWTACAISAAVYALTRVVQQETRRSRDIAALALLALVAAASMTFLVGRGPADSRDGSDSVAPATNRGPEPPAESHTTPSPPADESSERRAGLGQQRVTFSGGPATAVVLGGTVTIGRVDLADDGEDIVARVTLRVGDRRCPRSGSWREARTGERFTLATHRARYDVEFTDIAFGGIPDEVAATVTRRRAGDEDTPGCRRS